jgi:hypothetical protein
MKEAIGYLRVSTREQGRSGLGLCGAATRYRMLLRCAKGSPSALGTRMYRLVVARMRCCGYHAEILDTPTPISAGITGTYIASTDRWTENPRVGGSIPPLATITKLSIPKTWVTSHTKM